MLQSKYLYFNSQFLWFLQAHDRIQWQRKPEEKLKYRILVEFPNCLPGHSYNDLRTSHEVPPPQISTTSQEVHPGF